MPHDGFKNVQRVGSRIYRGRYRRYVDEVTVQHRGKGCGGGGGRLVGNETLTPTTGDRAHSRVATVVAAAAAAVLVTVVMRGTLPSTGALRKKHERQETWPVSSPTGIYRYSAINSRVGITARAGEGDGVDEEDISRPIERARISGRASRSDSDHGVPDGADGSVGEDSFSDTEGAFGAVGAWRATRCPPSRASRTGTTRAARLVVGARTQRGAVPSTVGAPPQRAAPATGTPRTAESVNGIAPSKTYPGMLSSLTSAMPGLIL